MQTTLLSSLWCKPQGEPESGCWRDALALQGFVHFSRKKWETSSVCRRDGFHVQVKKQVARYFRCLLSTTPIILMSERSLLCSILICPSSHPESRRGEYEVGNERSAKHLSVSYSALILFILKVPFLLSDVLRGALLVGVLSWMNTYCFTFGPRWPDYRTWKHHITFPEEIL